VPRLDLEGGGLRTHGKTGHNLFHWKVGGWVGVGHYCQVATDHNCNPTERKGDPQIKEKTLFNPNKHTNMDHRGGLDTP